MNQSSFEEERARIMHARHRYIPPSPPSIVKKNPAKTFSTVRDRVSKLFQNEKYADIYFTVGEHNERVPAHKIVLSVGSDVFNAMFYGEMEESSEESIKQVHIADVEPDGFKAFLRYLYTDEVVIDSETVMNTLYAAKKYAVQGLSDACVNFLSKNINPQNAFLLLGQSEFFGETELSEQCLRVIDRNTTAAFDSPSFTTIKLEILCSVLKRTTLTTGGLQVFQACLKWEEQECNRKSLPICPANQREVLGDALNLIVEHHLDSIPVQQFSEYVSTSGIFNDNELVQLFQKLIAREKVGGRNREKNFFQEIDRHRNK